MKRKSLAMGLLLALSLLCPVGCTPTQTAQPVPSAAFLPEEDTVVEITSETTADTIDDMDSGSGEAVLYAKNSKGQEVWTHTFTIEAMTELPPVSPAAMTADRAYVEVGGTLYALSLADGTVLCQIFNLIFRHTQMIQPLLRDFFTGTLFHRFLYIIARYICEETIYPDTNLIFILILELSLTVDGPA